MAKPNNLREASVLYGFGHALPLKWRRRVGKARARNRAWINKISKIIKDTNAL